MGNLLWLFISLLPQLLGEIKENLSMQFAETLKIASHYNEW